MITKKTIQQYALNKPDVNHIIITIPLIAMIFGLMLVSSTFFENELQLIGFIGSGIMIGLSLTVSKNIFFPIGIIIFYNSVIQIQQNVTELTFYDGFETGFRAIGDALFIAFVIYWVVIFSQYTLAKIKRLDRVTDEPITNTKFIIGSVVSGSLYGIFMVISAV